MSSATGVMRTTRLYIPRDAIPFFKLRGLKELFASTSWFPSGQPPEFGALAIFIGSGLVTWLGFKRSIWAGWETSP